MKIQTKSKKVNKNWLNQHLNDPYVQAAQKDGYRARAAYKLKEIDETFKLLRPGQVVVDLGCAPGAWSQYVRRTMAPQGAAAGQLQGAIIGLDMLPMEPIEDVHFIQGDFREDEVLAQLQTVLAGRKVDVVVSDMAPNLSGHSSTDAARVAHLIELAVDFACQHLRPEGALVAKVFHGPGYDELVQLFRAHFQQVKPLKPRSSRDKSSETFLIGLHLKARP
ncbi:MAG: RlmE family RNA methyltransferase [Comamonas sp.]|jgi:23S rRNA (uridine2552-2'-O)-methyltransferase|nr:RlmE family RNA methyltransferase [Comamonas sp.]